MERLRTGSYRTLTAATVSSEVGPGTLAVRSFRTRPSHQGAFLVLFRVLILVVRETRMHEGRGLVRHGLGLAAEK